MVLYRETNGHWAVKEKVQAGPVAPLPCGSSGIMYRLAVLPCKVGSSEWCRVDTTCPTENSTCFITCPRIPCKNSLSDRIPVLQLKQQNKSKLSEVPGSGLSVKYTMRQQEDLNSDPQRSRTKPGGGERQCTSSGK